MRQIRILAAMALLACLGVPAAQAGPNAGAKIMLHALSPTTKSLCERSPNTPSTCAGYDNGVFNLPLYPVTHFVYLLVIDGSRAVGISETAFGLQYDDRPGAGIEVYEWHLCGDSEVPTAGWPAPGSGNRIRFDPVTRCQTSGNDNVGAVAPFGYLYCASYSPTVMSVVPHPDDTQAGVRACDGQLDVVPDDGRDPGCTFLGRVSFGGAGGINPCGRQAPCNNQPDCVIVGPDRVTSGDSTLVYDMDVYAGYSNHWNIQGNAEFVGNSVNTLTVRVRALAPGSFQLSFTYLIDPVLFHSCGRTITVEEPIPVVSSTWGSIKTLLE